MPRTPGRVVAGPAALSGTPGVGKSSVARRLAGRFRPVEVGELARRLGAARGRGRHVTVDLSRLRRALVRSEASSEYDLFVGHLAHLLPVGRVILLRCHPAELGRRLSAAHRGTRATRAANVVAEALDTILFEARRTRRPVEEVDTTGRSVAEVAREVAQRLARPPRRDRSGVNWLADPAVTAHLLDQGR